MGPEIWKWPIKQSRPAHHDDRIAILRTVPYKMLDLGEVKSAEKKPTPWRTGKALSLNISSSGMLLLMKAAPLTSQRLSLEAPIPRRPDRVAMLAEVRWTRPLPMAPRGQFHLVGVKFLLKP